MSWRGLALGVLVYDLLGGEPLLHPHLAALIRYIKARGQHRNIVVLITNGFLLTPQNVAALNDAGLDMMESAKTWGELRHHRAIQTTR